MSIQTLKVKCIVKSEDKDIVTNGYDNLYRWFNNSYRYANEALSFFYERFYILKSLLSKDEEYILNETKIQLLYKDKENNAKEIELLKKRQKEIFGEKDKEALDNMGITIKEFQNYSYKNLRDKYYNILPGSIRASISQMVYKDYNNDKIDVLQGSKTIRNYKKGYPVFLNSQGIIHPVCLDEDKMTIGFTVLSIPMLVILPKHKDKSGKLITLKKWVDGELKVRDSSYTIKNNDIFFNLVFDIDEKIPELDEKVVVGIDVGIKNVLVGTTNDNSLDRINPKSYSWKDIQKLRDDNYQQKRKAQMLSKYVKGGRGRNNKMKLLNKIADKEKRIFDYLNHVYSREAVDFAIKHKAAYIHMERLKGIHDRLQNDYIRKRWSYFDLQTKIEQKAKKYGIKVRYVEAKNTSRTCRHCGRINEDLKLTDRIWVCECGKEIDRDFNAAKNIANSVNFVK